MKINKYISISLIFLLVCVAIIILMDFKNIKNNYRIQDIAINEGKRNNIKMSDKNCNEENYIEAVLKIPTLNLEYPIFSSVSDENLKISACKLWGPELGKNGNYVIVGNNNNFDNVFEKLSIGDTIDFLGNDNKQFSYEVYDIKIVNSTDTSVVSQLTNGKNEVTLMTTADNGKRKLVIKGEKI